MSLLSDRLRPFDMQARTLTLIGICFFTAVAHSDDAAGSRHEVTLRKICTSDTEKAQAFKAAHPLLKFLYEQQCTGSNSLAKPESDNQAVVAAADRWPVKSEPLNRQASVEPIRLSSASTQEFYRLRSTMRLNSKRWQEEYQAPVVSKRSMYTVASLGNAVVPETSGNKAADWWRGMFVYALHQRSTGTSVTLNPDGSYWTAALLPGAVLPMGLHGNLSGLGVGYNWLVEDYTLGVTAEATTGELRMAQPYPNHRVHGLKALHARLGIPLKRAHFYLSLGGGSYKSNHQTETIRPYTASGLIGGLGLEYKMSEKMFVGFEVNRFLGMREPLYLVSGQPASDLLHVHEYSAARLSVGYKFR